MNGDLFTPPPVVKPKPVKSSNRIHHVYPLSNGRVVVFDDRGQELPEFGGRWEEMKDVIIANMAPTARVHE